MPIKADLDEIDWKILRELQNNGRITNVELAERVGISAPPCLRRVRKLEESGVIRGYRAILNGNSLGQDLVAFCSVGLHRQADADLKAFAEKPSNGRWYAAPGWFRANPISCSIASRVISTRSRPS